MSSCYSLNLELIKLKPPTTFSPSRKARTPRKRPNQTYNEAAAILSTAYPKIFTNPLKSTKSLYNRSPPFLSNPDDHGYLLQGPIKKTESRVLNSFEKAYEAEPRLISTETYDDDDDFSAESILDEEIEEGGIDSIMGGAISCDRVHMSASSDGYPVVEYGLRRELRAMRHVDEEDWWRFPSVNVADEKNNYSAIKKESSVIPLPNAGLRLKLDYDGVLKAWSDKGSPFSGDEPPGKDVQVRLSQIDLFPEEGGNSVLRYKEKRCTRLFSKKSKYQTTKLNADQRPRSKGRFVKTSNPIDGD